MLGHLIKFAFRLTKHMGFIVICMSLIHASDNSKMGYETTPIKRPQTPILYAHQTPQGNKVFLPLQNDPAISNQGFFVDSSTGAYLLGTLKYPFYIGPQRHLKNIQLNFNDFKKEKPNYQATSLIKFVALDLPSDALDDFKFSKIMDIIDPRGGLQQVTFTFTKLNGDMWSAQDWWVLLSPKSHPNARRKNEILNFPAGEISLHFDEVGKLINHQTEEKTKIQINWEKWIKHSEITIDWTGLSNRGGLHGFKEAKHSFIVNGYQMGYQVKTPSSSKIVDAKFLCFRYDDGSLSPYAQLETQVSRK